MPPARVACSVNHEQGQSHRLIGEAIATHEQQGKRRADYGERLIESLVERMHADGIKGFSRNNLWNIRQFYVTYAEKLHALRGELSWTQLPLALESRRCGSARVLRMRKAD